MKAQEINRTLDEIARCVIENGWESTRPARHAFLALSGWSKFTLRAAISAREFELRRFGRIL